jgi:hypothetical protein
MKTPRFFTPTAALLALGLLTTAIYAGLTFLFPFYVPEGATRALDMEKLARGREWAGGFYVVGVLLAFGALALALHLVPRARRALLLVAGFGLLNALILVWLYPISAIDVFFYVLQGRQEAIYGLNPLAVPASAIAQAEPLLGFVGQWRDVPSPYGPLWGVISAGVVRLGFAEAHDGPLAFKLVAFGAFALCLGVLAWGTRRNAQALLLFAWNPLVLLQGTGNGHNDLLMIAVGVLALVLWERRRQWAPAFVVLALAAAIKAPVLLLGPLLLAAVLRDQPTWRKRGMVFVAAAVLGAGTLALAYVLYWPPWESLAGLRAILGGQYAFTPVALAGQLLSRLPAPPADPNGLPRLLGLILFVAAYELLLWRVWRGELGLYTAGFWAFFLYLLTSSSFRIWYPLWVVPLGVLAHAELRDGVLLARMRWRTYLLSLTTEASAMMFTLAWRWVFNGGVLPQADWFWMHILVVPWQFGLPLLAPLLIRGNDEAAGAPDQRQV